MSDDIVAFGSCIIDRQGSRENDLCMSMRCVLVMCHGHAWEYGLRLVRVRSTTVERERFSHFDEVRDEVCVVDVS